MVRKNIKNMDTIQVLKSNYRKACDAYLQRFCELIEMDFRDAEWVDVGGCAEIGDYYVSMQDIITAVEQNISRHQFLEWYDYTLRCAFAELSSCNLEYWLRGCPRHSEERFRAIEDAKKRVAEAEEVLRRVMAEEEIVY